MKYLLDTNIVSESMRPNPAPLLLQHFNDTPLSDRCICAITLAELLYGALRKANTQKYLSPINDLAQQVIILSFDVAAARQYSSIRALLAQSGQVIEDADLQIGSIALANNLIMVTRNVKHFSRIPQLVIENWIDE